MVRKNKVLFVCYFATPVIQSFIIREMVHKNDDAVLMVYSRFKKTQDIDSIFQQVIYADDNNAVHFASNPQFIENSIVEYYDKVLADNGVSLDDFDTIYTGCDMLNDFAIYLSVKKKKYNYIESYKNQLCPGRNGIYKWHIEKENTHGSSDYFKVAEKHLSICGTSKYVDTIFSLTISDYVFPLFSKYKKINLNEGLIELSETTKRVLIDCFDYDDIRSVCAEAQNSVLLLTQRQWKYPLTDIETGIMYQYLVDYFCKPNATIAVKPHPSDRYNHKDFFNSSVVFPVSFPADLFPIINDFSIEQAITISSTSIEKLNCWCDNLLFCGEIYFLLWRDINRLYFAYELLNNLGLNNANIYRNNMGNNGEHILNYVNDALFSSNFKKNCWVNLASHFNGAAFCQDISFDETMTYDSYYNGLKNYSNNAITLYMPSPNNISFVDYSHIDLVDNFITLEISKTPTKDKIFADISSEYIYIYCVNPTYRSALRDIHLERELPNVGLNLTVKCVDNSKIKEKLLIEKINTLTERTNAQDKAIKELHHIIFNYKQEGKL